MTGSLLTPDGLRAVHTEWLIWRLSTGTCWAKRGDLALSRASLSDLDQALAEIATSGIAGGAR
ncbi:hypothetical protein ACLQ2R_03040 [Streptosporangium sp. DT93]|uniref:hypothetical protein n=1 Tax=Streptosporangium sp. DT93 TaxID=3393428 RepID=UPI003CEABD1C